MVGINYVRYCLSLCCLIWKAFQLLRGPKLLLFSFLYCPLWKNQSLCNPHLRMESPHLSLQTCQYVSQQRGMKDEERQWEEGRIGMIIRFPLGASLVAQTVKNPLTMQETWVWFLGWEDLLEKGMATHSSIIAWRIPWTEEPGRLQSIWSPRVRHDWVTKKKKKP